MYTTYGTQDDDASEDSEASTPYVTPRSMHESYGSTKGSEASTPRVAPRLMHDRYDSAKRRWQSPISGVRHARSAPTTVPHSCATACGQATPRQAKGQVTPRRAGNRSARVASGSSSARTRYGGSQSARGHQRPKPLGPNTRGVSRAPGQSDSARSLNDVGIADADPAKNAVNVNGVQCRSHKVQSTWRSDTFRRTHINYRTFANPPQSKPAQNAQSRKHAISAAWARDWARWAGNPPRGTTSETCWHKLY